MRAIQYTRTGDPDVLTLVERADPQPVPGEVRVLVHRSGVNPTDWKSRRCSGSVGGGGGAVEPPQVPGQDGAGVVDAVGSGDGSVAIYANNGGAEVTVRIGSQMVPNARWQFVLIYTAPADAKARAVDDVAAAVAAGAIRVGTDAGLPLHHYPLAHAAGAHAAVEASAVGKVLIDVIA